MSKHNTHTDPAQPSSHIEKLLMLRQVNDESSGADIFTNAEALQCPPWARGAYGGHIIAQSLLAAYRTVVPNFIVHSVHSHFLIPADIKVPVIYHVERVRDGNSFATRIIHVRQRQRLIVTAIASFVQDSKRPMALQHAVPIPIDERPPGDKHEAKLQSAAGQAGVGQPCDCVRSRMQNKDEPHERKLRQWIRTHDRLGVISVNASDSRDDSTLKRAGVRRTSWDRHQLHVAALAYMTDNYFLGTAFRVHNASRFSNVSASRNNEDSAVSVQDYLKRLAWEEDNDNKNAPKKDYHVDMVATLAHTVFFHEPRDFRADEWLLSEMDSPWAGNERGLVLQRIWSHTGILVATCVQEGVVRLSPHRSHGRL